MTETLCTHMTPLGQERLGWCGKLVPRVEAKITCLDSGVTLPPGEQGELWIRSPGVSWGGGVGMLLMARYQP